MAANNEALALAGRAPMPSRTHPRPPTDGGCACCNPEPTGKARIAQGKPAQLLDIDQESAWKEDMWAKRGLTEFIDQVMNQQ